MENKLLFHPKFEIYSIRSVSKINYFLKTLNGQDTAGKNRRECCI